MRVASGAALFAALALSAACQSQSAATVAEPAGKSAALRNMEQVATAAHRCWFAGRDPAFRDYSFANELNSFTGRPRFLLVPRGNYAGRPLLVVQAEGAAGRVTAFGPLMEGEHGARIAGDIARWGAGGTDCAASA